MPCSTATTARLAEKKGAISLIVESAYVRDDEHARDRPFGKPIGFHVILYNTLNRKLIRIPK